MNLILRIASISTVLSLSILLSFNSNAKISSDKIAERIKAIGQVCMEGDESCGSAAVAVALTSTIRSGEDIYEAKCGLCHAAGVGGAPKYATAQWTERATKGIDALLLTALSGINPMPAMGLCNDCSDDEIKSAIVYMIDSAP